MELIELINIDQLSAFLLKKGILKQSEKIKEVEKPGEGNMNVVLRIKTNERTFIAKQSKPYVQKYQDIPAPIDRINVENQFYKTIEKGKADWYLPKVIGYLPANHMLFLEDLGHSEDFSFIYEKREISSNHISQLTQIAKGIHESHVVSIYPENLELRKLNHQHIFSLPFLVNNGFSLDDIQDGLQEISLAYKNNMLLKEKITALGKKYLATTGGVLLHGDYYPGSWMNIGDKIFVLDPEFSFLGPAEFDLGVMVGHIVLATEKVENLDTVLKHYKTPINKELVREFAGVEIIRRLIGLAQLPLQRTIEEKKNLLELAKTWILDS